MLDLGVPTQSFAGLTLGRDEKDPHRYYAFPLPPRIAWQDGTPQVELLRFIRQGTLAGGHLRLAVELAPPAERLAEVEQLLRDAHRDDQLTLVPLPVLGGSASLLFAGRETDVDGGLTPLVSRLYGSCLPKLDSPYTAHFSAMLTAEGVRLIEAALRTGGAPIGLVYRLQVEGLRPAQRVTARVDWSRVYDHLSTDLREGYLLLTTDVQRIAERLLEQRVIAIDVVQALIPEESASGPAPADTTAAALAWIEREIVERFCEPVLPLDRDPARASLGSVGELVGVGAAFAVRRLTQTEHATAAIDFQRAQVVTRTLTLSAHLADVLADAPAGEHIFDAEPDHPFFARIALRLQTARPLAASHVKEVLGSWSYGATRATLRLTPEIAAASVEAWADAAADGTWTLQLDLTLAEDAPVDPGGRVQLETQRGQSRELTLDLDQLLGRRRIEVSVPPDPERLIASRVELRHLRGSESRSEQELVLTPTQPQQVAWFHGFHSGDLIVASTEHLLKSGRRLAGVSGPVDTSAWRLPSPFSGSLTVQLFSETDWSEIEQVLVALQKHADAPAGTLRFDQGGMSLAVNLDMPDPSDRSFRYRMTRTFASGAVEEDDWTESDVPVVLVGRVAANKLVVDVTPIGPELPAAGIVLIEVELSYIDPRNQIRDLRTALIHAVADRFHWEVAIRDPRVREYEYRVTVHRTSGGKQVGPWTRGRERILLIPITPV